jgi:heat shock protein HtpX
VSTVEEAIFIYWTSTLPLLVLTGIGASLATLFFVFLGNARNPRLRVSLLSGLYGLSTFFWIFVGSSLALCVLQKDMITYQTSGVQIAATAAVSLALVGSATVGVYVWYRAPQRLLDSMQTRPPGPEERWIQEYLDLLATYQGARSPQAAILITDEPQCMTVGSPFRDVLLVSEGMMDLLEGDELKSVLAHEFVHVLNRDARFKVFSTVMSRFLFFDPLSKFLDPAVHREREFLADEMGARLHGQPAVLASALLKIHESATAGPRHMALGILGRDRGIFSKYPPLKERVRRLLLLAEILGGP